MNESEFRWHRRDVTLNTEFEIEGSLADKSLEDGFDLLKKEYGYLYNSKSGAQDGQEADPIHLKITRARLEEMTGLLIALRNEQDQNRMNCQIPRPRLNDEIKYAETWIEFYSAIVQEQSEIITTRKSKL